MSKKNLRQEGSRARKLAQWIISQQGNSPARRISFASKVGVLRRKRSMAMAQCDPSTLCSAREPAERASTRAVRHAAGRHSEGAVPTENGANQAYARRNVGRIPSLRLSTYNERPRLTRKARMRLYASVTCSTATSTTIRTPKQRAHSLHESLQRSARCMVPPKLPTTDWSRYERILAVDKSIWKAYVQLSRIAECVDSPSFTNLPTGC